jgi:hypothetical protein
MSKCLTLLIITLVLITGCITPVPKDTPADIQTTGSVEVSSTPPGAEVYLDNVYKGSTPVTIIEQPGSHILELRLRDHQSWSKSIQIVGGTKVYMDTALAPVPVITSFQTTVPTTQPATVPTTISPTMTSVTMVTYSQAMVNLTGTYQGYTKGADRSSRQDPFTIHFQQSQKGLWGTIEPHYVLYQRSNTSTISGNINGYTVIFVETETGSKGGTIYNGFYDPGSRQIIGRWSAGISDGPFVITIT